GAATPPFPSRCGPGAAPPPGAPPAASAGRRPRGRSFLAGGGPPAGAPGHTGTRGIAAVPGPGHPSLCSQEVPIVKSVKRPRAYARNSKLVWKPGGMREALLWTAAVASATSGSPFDILVSRTRADGTPCVREQALGPCAGDTELISSPRFSGWLL